mgnify:CR=1 FL=1
MKKVIFLDRDGTLIVEPEDEQIDTLEKLEYLPGVFRNLHLISRCMDAELVMVTNQDGLGTETYPEEMFNLVQIKMLNAFKSEGILFHDIHIDRSRPEDNSPARKPGTAMLEKYIAGNYDLGNSYVIGDRVSDIQLAKNLGAKGILIADTSAEKALKANGLQETCVLITQNWDKISAFLLNMERSAEITRKTKETDISIQLNIEGTGKSSISTGLGFFDHILDQIARHSGCDLAVTVNGDLNVDEHHTIEDTALALGEAFLLALGNKRGIERYGFCLPMDDCLATVALDFGGRPYLEWEAAFKREKVGDVPTEMFMHFFKSFSDAAKCNLYIIAAGKNEHHKIEAIFKAFAKAVKMAVKREKFNYEIPSTKGVL